MQSGLGHLNYTQAIKPTTVAHALATDPILDETALEYQVPAPYQSLIDWLDELILEREQNDGAGPEAPISSDAQLYMIDGLEDRMDAICNTIQTTFQQMYSLNSDKERQQAFLMVEKEVMTTYKKSTSSYRTLGDATGVLPSRWDLRSKFNITRTPEYTDIAVFYLEEATSREVYRTATTDTLANIESSRRATAARWQNKDTNFYNVMSAFVDPEALTTVIGDLEKWQKPFELAATHFLDLSKEDPTPAEEYISRLDRFAMRQLKRAAIASEAFFMIMERCDVNQAWMQNSTNFAYFGLPHKLEKALFGIDWGMQDESYIDTLYVHLLCGYAELQQTASARLHLWIRAYALLVREKPQRTSLGDLMKLVLETKFPDKKVKKVVDGLLQKFRFGKANNAEEKDWIFNKFQAGLACAFDDATVNVTYVSLDGWLSQQQKDLYGNITDKHHDLSHIQMKSKSKGIQIAQASLMSADWPCSKATDSSLGGTNNACIAFQTCVTDSDDRAITTTDIRIGMLDRVVGNVRGFNEKRRWTDFQFILRFVSKLLPLANNEVGRVLHAEWVNLNSWKNTPEDLGQRFVSWISDGNPHMQVARKVLGGNTAASANLSMPMQLDTNFPKTARLLLTLFRASIIPHILESYQHRYLILGALPHAINNYGPAITKQLRAINNYGPAITKQFEEAKRTVNKDMEMFLQKPGNNSNSVLPVECAQIAASFNKFEEILKKAQQESADKHALCSPDWVTNNTESVQQWEEDLKQIDACDKIRIGKLRTWLEDPTSELDGIQCKQCGDVYSRFIDYSAHCICLCQKFERVKTVAEEAAEEAIEEAAEEASSPILRVQAMWQKAGSLYYKDAMVRMIAPDCFSTLFHPSEWEPNKFSDRNYRLSSKLAIRPITGSLMHFPRALIVWKALTHLSKNNVRCKFTGTFAMMLNRANSHQIKFSDKMSLFWMILIWIDAGHDIDMVVEDAEPVDHKVTLEALKTYVASNGNRLRVESRMISVETYHDTRLYFIKDGSRQNSGDQQTLLEFYYHKQIVAADTGLSVGDGFHCDKEEVLYDEFVGHLKELNRASLPGGQDIFPRTKLEAHKKKQHESLLRFVQKRFKLFGKCTNPHCKKEIITTILKDKETLNLNVIFVPTGYYWDEHDEEVKQCWRNGRKSCEMPWEMRIACRREGCTGFGIFAFAKQMQSLFDIAVKGAVNNDSVGLDTTVYCPECGAYLKPGTEYTLHCKQCNGYTPRAKAIFPIRYPVFCFYCHVPGHNWSRCMQFRLDAYNSAINYTDLSGIMQVLKFWGQGSTRASFDDVAAYFSGGVVPTRLIPHDPGMVFETKLTADTKFWISLLPSQGMKKKYPGHDVLKEVIWNETSNLIIDAIDYAYSHLELYFPGYKASAWLGDKEAEIEKRENEKVENEKCQR